MTEKTVWLKRPVFNKEGTAYTLEKFKEVPANSIIEIGPVTFEELKNWYWKENND